MKTPRYLIPSLLAFAAFSGHSYAALLKVGVSFNGRGGSETLQIGVNDSTGVVAQTDWNNLGNNFDGISGNFTDPGGNNLNGITSGALFTDDGLANSRGTSAVTVTVTSSDAWRTDGGNGTPAEKLMKGEIKAGNTQGGVPGGRNALNSVVINNLNPATHYKLIAYGGTNGGGNSDPNNGNSVKANFGLAGLATYDTYYFLQYNNYVGSFVQGTNTANVQGNRALANYVQWNDVVPAANGKLNFSYTWVDGGDGVGVNGFQLIELPPASTGSVFWNNGNIAGNWDTTSTNWRTTNDAGASNTAFAVNNATTFGNLGTAGARVVTVDAGGVTPGDIVVSNASGNNYTIGGGAILGAGSLTKDGAGALTLSGANEFIGSVTLKHGTTNVTTIGDSATAGNLGKGSLITIGDTGANDAVLNYTGSTATAARSITVGASGGTVNVTNTLTLVSLTGTGPLAKGGVGSLIFDGPGSTFSGDITVSNGTLSTRTVGSGAGSLTLNTGTAFNITGSAPVQDGRSLTLSGNASVGVNDAAGNYALNGAVNTTQVLTKTGNGRLELGGTLAFTQLPVISGGTLALTKEGSITLPAAAVNIGSGARLEVVPGALTASNPVTLSGGALRLGHQGLTGTYFTGGYDQGDWLNRMNSTATNIANSFVALGAPALIARTNTAGQTNLDFTNNNFSNATAPFASQGLADTDNIRALFRGKIRIDSTGSTTFFTNSDDGSGLFIDGQRIVLNNNFQATTTRQGAVTLSAGLHDISMFYYEGGGGAGFLAEYTPAGGTRQTIPNSVLYAADSVDYTATTVNVTAASTIESGATSAQVGGLTLPVNTLLTVNGSTSFAGTTLTGSSHQVAVTGYNANTNLGALSAATTLTKTGNGNLIFSNAPIAGTSIASNDGLIVNMGSTGVDPLAGISLTYGGGGLGLSSTSGNVTYTTSASSSSNLTVAAGSFGNSNTAATTITYSPASLAAPTGNTLTLRTNNDNYTLDVTTQITGSGNIVTEEGANLILSGGVNNTGNFTNKISNVSVTGALTTNALVEEGNLNSIGNNLITGGIYANALNTSGTVNAQSLSVTGGTYNSSGALTVVNAAAVSAGTANINGVLAAGSVTLNGSGNLNLRNNATVTGVTTVDAGRTLNLDMGAGNTHTYTGNVTVQNQSTLRAASGTTDFGSSAITVTPRAFASGVIESMNDTANNADNGFTLGAGRAGQPTTGGLKNSFRLGNDNTTNSTTAWGDNDLWVYTGQFYDADGSFSFAENVDDAVRVRIDGVLVLANDQWDHASNTNSTLNNTANFNNIGVPAPNTGNSYGMGPEGNGWHNIEVRMFNGGGGAGPSGNNGPEGAINWNAGKGFVFSVTGNNGIDANNFTILTDPGDSTVLRSVSNGGYITVEAGAKIAAGSTTGAQVLQLNGSGSPALFQLNNNASQTASNTDRLKLNGGSASGSVFLGDNNTFNVGQLIVPDGGNLTVDKAASATIGGILKITGIVPGTPGTASSTIGTGNVTVQGGTLIVNAPVTGTGTITASLSGTIGGSGTVAGPVVAGSGGTIAPGGVVGSGLELGALSTGDFTLNTGATLRLDVTDSLGYDSVNVTGAVTLGGALLVSKLSFAGTVGDVYYIVNNDGADAVVGTFTGLNDGATYTSLDGAQYKVSYDAISGGAFETGGNDVALQLLVVPEPGTVAALLGGLGLLMGMRRRRQS